MPRKDYPRNPSLVHFKHQAKDLLKASLASAPEAVARITEFHPHLVKDSKPLPIRLSDAQFVIAREYGFANWEKLRTCTLTLEKYGRDTEKSVKREIPAEAFLQLICLNYGMDHPSRREEAQQIFARHPEIRGSSIHVAAATGDSENTLRLLEKNPVLARTKGGPMEWEPLMYATYARFANPASWSQPAETIRLLLEHGADPNAAFLWDKSMCLFTALTGVFGEGEAGPTNQPPHAEAEVIARMLLRVGADPNDSQALYNRQFTKGSAHLRLLLDFGLGKVSKGPWRKRLGDKLPAPEELLQHQLFWSAEHDHFDRIELLVNQGIPLDQPNPTGKTAAEVALLNGYPQIARYLWDHGAPKLVLPPEEAFIAALNEGSTEKALHLLKQHTDLLEKIRSRQTALLISAAGGNRLSSVKLMLDLGFPVNGAGRNTALHEAAWFGHLEMVRMLVAHGADLSLRDHTHQARAADWARYNNQAEVAEFLEEAGGGPKA